MAQITVSNYMNNNIINSINDNINDNINNLNIITIYYIEISLTESINFG